MASGMALTMAPATESIMGSLPLGKAGVGSAVNDTTRQVGGALGVAVIGSVLASIYGSQVGDFLQGKPVPERHREGARAVARARARARASEVPGPRRHRDRRRSSTACTPGVLVAAGVALLGAVDRVRLAPARAPATTRSPRSPLRPRTRPAVEAEPRCRDRDGRDRDRAGAPGRPRSTEADEAILEAAVDALRRGRARRRSPSKASRHAPASARPRSTAATRQARPRRRSAVRRSPSVGASAARHRDHPRRPAGAGRRPRRASLTDDADRTRAADPGRRPHPRPRARSSRTPRSSPTSGRAARRSIRRGIERGELRADVDPELVVDIVRQPGLLPLPRHQRPLDDAFRRGDRRHHHARVRYLSRPLVHWRVMLAVRTPTANELQLWVRAWRRRRRGGAAARRRAPWRCRWRGSRSARGRRA